MNSSISLEAKLKRPEDVSATKVSSKIKWSISGIACLFCFFLPSSWTAKNSPLSLRGKYNYIKRHTDEGDAGLFLNKLITGVNDLCLIRSVKQSFIRLDFDFVHLNPFVQSSRSLDAGKKLNNMQCEESHCSNLLFFFRLTDQITTCRAKRVACSDEQTDNYHPTLQFPSALWKVLASFRLLFWFSCLQLYSFGSP